MKLKPTQLLLDVLMTDGHPSVAPAIIPQPHLPILACNMDLQWMAEAPMVGSIQNFGGKILHLFFLFSQDLVMEPSCCVLKIFTRS